MDNNGAYERNLMDLRVIEPTAQQLTIIEQQLGRPPRGLVGIAHQTADGIPVVLQMRSLVDDQPFPTLYWLCSRDLHRALAQIEDQGIFACNLNSHASIT